METCRTCGKTFPDGTLTLHMVGHEQASPGCFLAGCWMRGAFRVSDPADPEPLRYACAMHLVECVRSFPGTVKVKEVQPSEPTPRAR